MGNCRVCASETKRIISFGKMPIANGFLEKASADEFFYNLSVVFCTECFTVQLDETVKPEMMFNDSYHFISSTSSVMAAHFEKIAMEILERISAEKNPYVVELGCNDGIMLKHIAARGINHLGIEPSGNVASLARNNKVSVLEKFFNEETASGIVKDNRQADIVCGTNVFCHIEDINSVFKGVDVLLKEDGILFFEEPYLLDIIKKSSFDQIYDEHVYYYSGLSVSELVKRHNMQLVDMAHQDVHGGSMRYYVKKGRSNIVTSRVKHFLSEERRFKLDRLEGYSAFKDNMDKICLDLHNTLRQIKKEGRRIVGYGATSKSTTLLNYCNIGPDLVDFISDTTPIKQGKLSPGMHIPVRPYEEFVADYPDYALLFAWNHAKEIMDKEKRFRSKGGKFIVYVPSVKILDE